MPPQHGHVEGVDDALARQLLGQRRAGLHRWKLRTSTFSLAAVAICSAVAAAWDASS